jgi:hypothetical protein
MDGVIHSCMDARKILPGVRTWAEPPLSYLIHSNQTCKRDPISLLCVANKPSGKLIVAQSATAAVMNRWNKATATNITSEQGLSNETCVLARHAPAPKSRLGFLVAYLYRSNVICHNATKCKHGGLLATASEQNRSNFNYIKQPLWMNDDVQDLVMLTNHGLFQFGSSEVTTKSNWQQCKTAGRSNSTAARIHYISSESQALRE